MRRGMEQGISRRELVVAGTGAATALSLGAVPGWARKRPPGLLRTASFPSGVMAGRPFQHGTLLWTQLAPDEQAGRLRLEIARDREFSRIVHEQNAAVRPNADLTALARVGTRRLRPGREYFYRFRTRTTSSPTGRFVTARPADSRDPLRIGFFSCQDWGSGYYTAHTGLAAEDCDLIVCLGDYLYETNTDGNVPGRADHTSEADSGECELLPEYRAKYRLYRSDPALRAMQASAPLIATWDDHEVEDNYAGENGGKTADQRPERRIPFPDRRANGYRAFFEQMPVRPAAKQPNRLYRRVSLGGVVDVFILDERQHRSDQTCGDLPGVPCPPPPPDHTLLGRPQMEWFKRSLAGSDASWKLLASSVEMMGWESAPGVPVNRDGWDGYPADRREIGEHVLANEIEGVTVISGDVHHFASGTVTTSGNVSGDGFGTEFVGGSITSGFLDQPFASAAEQSRNTNPHMTYQRFDRRGYGILELTADALSVQYRSPATIEETTSPIETIASFSVARGSTDVEQTG
jgi:alkaline phosphatase D